MKVAEALGSQYFPKRCMSRNSLRKCTTRRKGDDIVIIDVDSDDFGDVIILDVPESFHEKFKKNKEPCIIRIDDDDYDDNNNVEAGERDSEHTDNQHHTDNGPSITERDCNPTTNEKDSDPTTRERDSGPTSGERHSDPTTSTRFSPTPAASFSKDANVDVNGLYFGEGGIPVKLSKSKRTYSGKAIPRNRYGLSSDSESCSSESDSSDCEFMEDSSGLLREQWEKASLRKRHVSKCNHFDEKNIAGASTSGNPVHGRAWEGVADKVKRTAVDVDTETSEPVNADSDEGAESEPANSDTEESATESSESIHRSSEESSEESSEFFSNQSISGNLNNDGVAADLTKECTSAENDSDSNEMFGQASQDHGCSGGSSDLENHARPSVPHQSFRCNLGCSGAEQLEIHSEKCCSTSSFDHDNGDPTGLYAEKNNYSQQPGFAKQTDEVSTDDHPIDAYIQTDYASDRQQNPVTPSMQLDNHGDGDRESNCFDPDIVVTDRQKIKESEEYKRALEDELAARQEQLQRQAEEAKRLRDRKRAHNMRIMVNERRQKQRVEEIRETRRKDEENLNLKEKLRAQIRIELRKLEITCFDMASLLRSLGIQVGGGFFPSTNEVQAAYKRACLKFHPDRFSRTDLRQQVEAEEKFKLISNMKDKFL